MSSSTFVVRPLVAVALGALLVCGAAIGAAGATAPTAGPGAGSVGPADAGDARGGGGAGNAGRLPPATTSEPIFVATDAGHDQDVLARSHERLVVVNFWAPWCGPCKSIKPAVEKAAKDGAGVWLLGEYNTEDHKSVAASLGVKKIPSFAAFGGGALLEFKHGWVPTDLQFRAWIEAMKAKVPTPQPSGSGTGGPLPSTPVPTTPHPTTAAPSSPAPVPSGPPAVARTAAAPGAVTASRQVVTFPARR